MKYFSTFLIALFLLILSCSDRTPPEDPPTLKPTVVIELFDALKTQNYEEAIAKIKVLRQLNDNVFLAQLEEQQRQNLFVAKIQNAVDSNQLDEARRICKEAKLAFPKSDKFESIERTLSILILIQDTVDALLKSQNWVQTSRNAAKLKTIANSYLPASSLIEVANQKLLEAKEQMLREQKLSLISLSAEILATHQNANITNQTLLILLSILDPKNPILMENYPK